MNGPNNETPIEEMKTNIQHRVDAEEAMRRLGLLEALIVKNADISQRTAFEEKALAQEVDALEDDVHKMDGELEKAEADAANEAGKDDN